MQTAGVFGSAILEVAIGLIFLYFLLSSISSSVNELIATALKWRARNLEWALGNLITDPALLAQVLNHPLIRSMGQNPSPVRGQERPTKDLKDLEGKPSYIPSTTFSLAVLHSLSNPADAVPSLKSPADGSINVSRVRETAQALANNADDAAKKLTGQAVLALMEGCRDPQATAQSLDTLKKRLQDGLVPTSSTGFTQLQIALAAATNLDGVRKIVADLPDPTAQQWAQAIVNSSQDEIDAATYKLERLRTSVETWFDHAMDRASGVYKRKALWVLGVIAFVLTIASGADSINFVTRLYVDSAVRAQLSQQASQSPQSPDITKAVQSLEPFATLFGYADYPAADPARATTWVLLKIVGEVITVFAILLGAPFWFDLLTKLVNLRGSGPKPASTTDAARANTR